MTSATPFTWDAIAAATADMPFSDRQDFDDATRGFIGRSSQRQVTADAWWGCSAHPTRTSRS